jgi:hypothetical protein
MHTTSESTFELPIFYSPSKISLSQTIVDDLELIKTVDASLSSMYSIIMRPSSCFGESVVSKFSKYYTTDVSFLKDTQTLLNTYTEDDQEPKDNGVNMQINELWRELKEETGFCEKYLYIDWEMGKFLNTHSSFLQVMSIYNITSPIISFCLPLIILIVPFFIIHAKGLAISTSEYIEILTKIMENHAIGKLFIGFDNVSLSEKAYIVCSTALYIFSIYQNMMVCLRFYKNVIKINNSLQLLKTYITNSITKFESYLSQTKDLVSYTSFNNAVRENCNSLIEYKSKIDNIGDLDFSWKNIFNIGDRMHLFYHIYDSLECNQIMLYSFDMHGYLNNMNGLIQNLKLKRVNCALISVSNKATVFKDAYYPALIDDEQHVKNTCDFSKSIVLSGPNASGKTTVLKTSIINIILTQQFGCGCYTEATITPFKFIHCYLNIPDTSGRDSLFQAEARRCKDIIDIIENNTEDKHFCAFDELYSGTNPEDAVASSLAFMQYISSNTNVSSILTTHYNKVCRKLKKNKMVQTYCMKTIATKNNTFCYSYKLIKGISDIKGGLKVLKDLNYPVSIIENTQNIISSFHK